MEFAWVLFHFGQAATDENEVVFVFITMIGSLVILVLLGKWWERR